MSKIVCRCGNILSDNTDRISYKGHIISDQEYFDLFDLADEMIESNVSCREDLAMTFRRNIGFGETSYIRLRDIFQCPLCGRILVENASGEFCLFAPEEHDEKNLLDYAAGEKIEYIHKKR